MPTITKRVCEVKSLCEGGDAVRGTVPVEVEVHPFDRNGPTGDERALVEEFQPARRTFAEPCGRDHSRIGCHAQGDGLPMWAQFGECARLVRIVQGNAHPGRAGPS